MIYTLTNKIYGDNQVSTRIQTGDKKDIDYILRDVKAYPNRYKKNCVTIELTEEPDLIDSIEQLRVDLEEQLGADVFDPVKTNNGRSYLSVNYSERTDCHGQTVDRFNQPVTCDIVICPFNLTSFRNTRYFRFMVKEVQFQANKPTYKRLL